VHLFVIFYAFKFNYMVSHDFFSSSSAAIPEVEADRATPAMEDTNTNPDTCSHAARQSPCSITSASHQLSQIEPHELDQLWHQDSSALSIGSVYHVLPRSRLPWFSIGSVPIEKCL